MKKIFAFIGSNSEFSITKEYVLKILEGTNLINNPEYCINIIHANKSNIKMCKGCSHCFSKGSCVLDFEDDMKYIKEFLLKSDIIIFASPVYANQVSGIMKNFLDRISYWIHLLRLSGKKGIIVTTSAQENGWIETARYLAMFAGGLGINFFDPIHFAVNDYNNKEKEETISNKLEMASKIIDQMLKSEELTNKINENHFMHTQEFYAKIADEVPKKDYSYDIQYWADSGMLEAKNLNEWLNSCKARRYHEIDN